jgi:UDP:flavonoid glycosyltransferase YjiC (YdhE family)
MNYLIPTIGTRGDVQPYIALALGLNKAGDHAVVASHPCMRGLVESYGVEFAPIGPDIDIGKETAIIRGRSPNWMIGFMRVMRFSFNMLDQAHPDLLALCRQADWVIVSHSAAGSVEADQLGLPTISATLMPQAIPAPDPNASIFKRAIMSAAGAGMGLMMTRPLNQIRKRYGVAPMGRQGITSLRLNMVPISPAVIPPDPRWEPRHQMTGYWFAPAPVDWQPDEELSRFLDAGDPPVVISLGAMSISGDDALEAAKMAVEAVRMSGVRAVIQGWDEPLKQIQLPPEIFHAGSVPHDWLLAHACAVIHHGGFGTTSSGFRAGILQIVIPHIIDQFIWGQKVYELGVGPKPIERAKLTPEILFQAVRQVMDNEELRQKAAGLGERIRSEDGVGNAVQLIEQLLVNPVKTDMIVNKPSI